MPKRKIKKVDFKNSKLTPQQELFCQLYASDREFFGNGLQSYMEAYDLDSSKWKTAKANAYRLLTKAYILDRVNVLMDHTINDIIVDKELAFVVKQKADLSSKVAAIREYNKLKKRVSDTPALPPAELHLHLHKNEKVVQIIREAENRLLETLNNDIKEEKDNIGNEISK